MSHTLKLFLLGSCCFMTKLYNNRANVTNVGGIPLVLGHAFNRRHIVRHLRGKSRELMDNEIYIGKMYGVLIRA